MNIVIAMDSFKGSMSSLEAGAAVKMGVLKAVPKAAVQIKPMADGGEGTADAILTGSLWKKIPITVKGPMGNPTKAYYGILQEENTAVIEVAAAAGITLVTGEKNPLISTTYGVGEMIRDAIEKGCRDFIIGIGGSATNDGGIGMLLALGYQFFDLRGNETGEGAAALIKVSSIKSDFVIPELKKCRFKIACDVKNPLCGENGATYVFGPQKGILPGQAEQIDCAMRNFAKVSAKFLGRNHAMAAGAGAAGGLGFAFLSYLQAEFVSGASMVCEVSGLEEAVKNADFIITGEGRLDAQTMMGKAPLMIAELAKRYEKKVIAFAGSVSSDAGKCNDRGVDAFFPIVRGVSTLEESMKKENAMKNLADTAEQVFRLIARIFPLFLFFCKF